MLDHLGEPRAVLALGQGREGRGIDHHQPGLVERADEVFLGARVVDGGFAADRGIHLGEQRGGDLDEIDPPHERCRGEAREVAHGATSHGHHRRGAVAARLQEVIPDLAKDVERLGLLALGQQHLRHLEAGRATRPRVTGSPCRRRIVASVKSATRRPTRSLASCAPTSARPPSRR